MYPKKILELIEIFEKLPSIGHKTAERLVFHILNNFDENEIDKFNFSLNNLKEIKKCEICQNITENNICDICIDEKRLKNIIMVVSDVTDLYRIEESKMYFGKYHVLNGLINFSKGIDIEDLNIESLFLRLNEVEEVIVATNNTLEGELTANYIKERINSNFNIKVTKLGYGLPAGGDIKYADNMTLQKAFENRLDI